VRKKPMTNKERFVDKLRQASTQMQIAYWTFATLTVVKFSLSGLGNDFEPFYFAGLKARHLTDPWIGGADYVYSAYINGPLTLLLIIPFSFFGNAASLLILRVSTVVCLPILTRLILNVFRGQVSLSKTDIYSSSLLLLFTFPVRSNLEYGQFFIIVITLMLAALSRLLESNTKYADLILGFTICFILDFKPQVFIPVAFYVLARRHRALFGVLVGILAQLIISLAVSRNFPFKSWLEALRAKREGGFTTIDQMNLYAISKSVIVSILIASTVLFLIVYYIKAFSVKLRINSESLIFIWLLWFLFVPYLHPTDLVVPVGMICVAVFSKGSNLLFLALGSALVWSNSTVLMFITLIIITFALKIYNKKSALFLWIPNIVFILSIKLFPYIEMSLRQVLNYSALIFYFFVIVQNYKDSKSLSNSDY
jgi:hypothetical protein